MRCVLLYCCPCGGKTMYFLGRFAFSSPKLVCCISLVKIFKLIYFERTGERERKGGEEEKKEKALLLALSEANEGGLVAKMFAMRWGIDWHRFLPL